MKQSKHFGTNPAYVTVEGSKEAQILMEKLFQDKDVQDFAVVYSAKLGWRVYHYGLEPKTDEFWEDIILEWNDLQYILEKVAKHYITRALSETGNNKSKSAELLGLPSYQTLTNWIKKYGIKE